MSLRIRQDGRILCAAMHPAESGDTYLHDGLHYMLSAELGALVTEPMYCETGRGGHARHGEWWWRHEVPGDVCVAFEGDVRRGASLLTRAARAMLLALSVEVGAARASSATRRARCPVALLNVVALGAGAVVVVHVASRLCGVKGPNLWHRVSSFVGRPTLIESRGR